jgi:hypothetical protein
MLLAAVMALTAAGVAPARATLITPGTPTKDGTDTITVTLANGTVKVAKVAVTEGMTRELKADAIQSALNDVGVNSSVTATFGVNVAGTPTITIAATSGETDAVSLLLTPGDKSYAQTDLHFASGFGALAGVNADGGAATYTAGFDFSSPGLGEISLLAALGYGDLVTPTLPGVLQQQFNVMLGQLQAQAPSLAGALSLDMPNGAIVFQPAGAITSESATSGTTDVGLTSTLSVTVVPEAGGVVVLGAGVAGVWAAGRRRGRG